MDGEPAVAAGVLSFESRDCTYDIYSYRVVHTHAFPAISTIFWREGWMGGGKTHASRLYHTLALELRAREEQRLLLQSRCRFTLCESTWSMAGTDGWPMHSEGQTNTPHPSSAERQRKLTQKRIKLRPFQHKRIPE